MMCDFEDSDFWDSWISPVKRKRKKNSQKDPKCVKLKNATGKTDESSKKKKRKKKKKRNSVFKEAMGEWKDKKKEKKRKKQNSSVGLDDSFLVPQGFSCAEPEHESAHRTQNLTEDAQKKTKRKKKKVAFALSPGPIAIKRPRCSSSSSPKETIALQTGDGGGRPHDNDSQVTSDDVNSQDLFITQKTFRTSPVESSSGEASGSAPERRLHPSPRGSNTRPHESGSHQRPKATPVEEEDKEDEEEEEEDGLYLTKQISKKEPSQTELNTNLLKVKSAYRPRHVKKIWNVNPFLDDPFLLKPKTMTRSCPSGRPSPSCPLNPPEPSLLPQKSNTSTQTENFFTAELSSFLKFCLKVRAVCSEDLQPLDLSLPQRARNPPGWGQGSGGDRRHEEEKTPSPPDQMSRDDQEDLAPSRSSSRKKEPSGRQRQRKVPTPPSPESESQPKSTDTTTSSEDNETASGPGKQDMTQVRAVQMRLNESFFFKAKGDGRSHRPESPLMKLAQGREEKQERSLRSLRSQRSRGRTEMKQGN